LRFHLSLIVRSTFEKHGFMPLITLKNDQLVMIAIDLNAKIEAKSRLREALELLQHRKADDKTGSLKLRFGVGKPYTKLKNAHNSYQEAVQALSLHAYYSKPFLFYEDLGVFQLLLNLNDEKMLQAFIRNYIGPLIEHDQTKGSDMVHTLKVYLDCDCSKQIAAQKLFIVRQSLYYRLEKITDLLGEDFLLPENRLAIQVALRAYQLLAPGNAGTDGKKAPG
jgi:purine catabolism regulator